MNPYSNVAASLRDFVNNLVQLKTHEEDIDMRGRQLQQQKDQFEVTNATSKFELEEAKKKQEAMQKPIDIKVHPIFLSLPDESKQEALKFFSTNQFTDGNGIGTAGNIMRGVDILEKSKPLFQTIMGPVVKAKQAGVITAWDEFQQAQATLDPKKIQIAKAKYDQAYLAYGESLGKFDEHMKTLDAQEQAMALKQMENAGKSQTEEQLTQRALGGDKGAQAILDAMQSRKVETARAGAAVIAGEKDKAIDVPGLARAVADGQDAPVAIKGSMGNPLAAKVKSQVLRLYPKFDFNMADANYKWKQSSTNQRTVNFAGGALPRLGALDDQLTKLGNADINVINKVMATVSKQFGKPEYTNYESNRNAIVQEIGTALSGTSQASDLRIKIELENLESARSPSQIRGAISNLREALIARLDVDLSPLYPIEVVRGEMSLKQFKDDMFKKFRGKYGKYGEGVAPQGSPSKGRFTILKVE